MNPRWPGSRSFGSNETYQVLRLSFFAMISFNRAGGERAIA
jgi:hypothetical protein